MKITHESGRTLTEVLAVLALMGILSVSSVFGLKHLINKNKINEIINHINLASIQILTDLSHQKIETPDSMDSFLAHYKTRVHGYGIEFKAPRDTDREFTGTEFVAEITDEQGNRIKGSICRQIITSMVQMEGVSDISFKVNNEELEDGTTTSVAMRLSGKAVDLNALCGKDVF